MFFSRIDDVTAIELFEYIQNVLNIRNESRREQERKIKGLGIELHHLNSRNFPDLGIQNLFLKQFHIRNEISPTC